MENINKENKLELISNLAKEKKAMDLINLDVREVNDLTDILIICSAEGDIHTRTIGKYIIEQTKKLGITLHHKEGLENGKWVLLDFSDIVIHIFDKKTREYYKLEKLWKDLINRDQKTSEEVKK
ncbi:MAG: ribosome silencing factor [Candidatus Cloacimonetes bacterium]|nr:ribosome silencing factor [Candidatus Cloacimonadota bacterium]